MEDKLLKRITTCLEEFGMPKFQDRFPAMEVLQLIKDHGYSKHSAQQKDSGLAPLDELNKNK